MILPFFQFLMMMKMWGEDDPTTGPAAGVFMKYWTILKETLNFTQVFGVVCL
jgi:hypothetical protein